MLGDFCPVVFHVLGMGAGGIRVERGLRGAGGGLATTKLPNRHTHHAITKGAT